MANHMGFSGAEIHPHASQYQDKLPGAYPGPPTHQRLLWVHKAPPASSQITELDQVKHRPRTPEQEREMKDGELMNS